jgi:hypothetical protein
MSDSRNRAAKILLAVVLAFTVPMIGSGALLAASVVRAGTLTVKIHEPGAAGRPGTHIDLMIPAAVVYLGMDVIPWVLEEDLAAEIRADLGEYRPAVAAALLELEDAPDAVLVDVRDAAERVRIAKRGRSLEISVDNADGQFEITLPAGLLGRLAREI